MALPVDLALYGGARHCCRHSFHAYVNLYLRPSPSQNGGTDHESQSMRERESFAGPGFDRQLIAAAPIFFLYSSAGYFPRI
jgi:hypothetical protein